ncbi:heme peroxidase [Aureobasidium subglaciale]|nr:heme peroxidase [Aureobasidium subglaciale]KAI5231233.1 heme peroxidase [Aureobasidium subglaciale]KAI5234164.1 heme peroxidase [Aureobasidium subglaciale]KAI5267532.1 heme peroxidase [Aureobasidium subglaciale]
MDPQNYQPGLLDRLLVCLFHVVNLVRPWHKLPSAIGALNLDALRVELRQYNLHDGYDSATAQGDTYITPLEDKRFLAARNSDGKDNSLTQPKMGCSGMRFGRNFPRKYCEKPTEEELWTPNPRLVSEAFMSRKPGEFKPATTLNLLAAAWIQFQVHDWVFHESSEDTYEVPLLPNDSWHNQMKIYRTKPDEVLDASDIKCPGYKNTSTAWYICCPQTTCAELTSLRRWDGSQIYGSSETKNEETFLPRDADGNPKTGFSDNWWTGIELLHTLFALEHNAVCDRIREAHPDWTGDKIFDKARLVNCALMAKIHTVEWTPAILAHPTMETSMNANWWGIAGETLNKIVGRISKTSEAISGIPGSTVDHQGVPYSLTEEFVSVYRMHSLIPDNVAFFDIDGGQHRTTIPVADITFKDAVKPLKTGGVSFADAFYSFCINYPGAITNNNYANLMRNLPTPDGQVRDLATVDILCDRERGVPRYCQFRRLLRMSVPKTFEELTGGNKELAARLSEVYNGDVETVDALVGSHSEPTIKGFGFSETAFRIFILMASRRLKSDRFIAGQ